MGIKWGSRKAIISTLVLISIILQSSLSAFAVNIDSGVPGERISTDYSLNTAEATYQAGTESVVSINSINADKASPQKVGTKIRWTCNITGGTNPVFFFKVYKESSVIASSSSFSPNNYFDWTLNELGSDYRVYVIAKESGYRSTEWSSNKLLKSKPGRSFVCGCGNRLTAKALGGTNLQYMFRVFDGKRYTNLSSYSDENTCIWTPEKPGTYRIFVYVMEEDSDADYDAVKKIVIEIE